MFFVYFYFNNFVCFLFVRGVSRLLIARFVGVVVSFRNNIAIFYGDFIDRLTPLVYKILIEKYYGSVYSLYIFFIYKSTKITVRQTAMAGCIEKRSPFFLVANRIMLRFVYLNLKKKKKL